MRIAASSVRLNLSGKSFPARRRFGKPDDEKGHKREWTRMGLGAHL
jgi:hypothetical protein